RRRSPRSPLFPYTTRFRSGHSDVVGGAVVAAEKSDVEELASWANVTGVTGAPFDSYLTLRGLRTLFPRIERQQQNAAAVAAFLEDRKSTRLNSSHVKISYA